MYIPSLSRAPRWLLVTPLAMAAVTLSACGAAVSSTQEADAAAGGNYPVKLTNCDRDLAVEQAPKRIVSLMPSQTELLVRLGLTDRLVGQAQTGTHPLDKDVAAQVKDVPVISADTPPAREDLLATQPDAVLSPTSYEFTAEQGFASIEQLEQASAVTYVATGGCMERRATAEVDDLLLDIDNLGRIFDVTAEAAALREETENRLAAVDEAIDGAEKPTVAQLYVEGKSVYAIGASVEYDIIKRAGGDNVFNPDEKLFEQFFSAAISPEEVAARNPDAIVFTVTGDAHEKQVRAYLAKTFPEVDAVKQNRLVALPASDVFPGTLGNVDAVEAIAAALYPDRL